MSTIPSCRHTLGEPDGAASFRLAAVAGAGHGRLLPGSRETLCQIQLATRLCCFKIFIDRVPLLNGVKIRGELSFRTFLDLFPNILEETHSFTPSKEVCWEGFGSLLLFIIVFPIIISLPFIFLTDVLIQGEAETMIYTPYSKIDRTKCFA